MDCKLLLFDLDGTLLKDDKTISDRTLRALEGCREKGLLIGVSTSRSEQNSMTFIEKLCPDIMISSGGALIQYRGKYVYKAEFTEAETAGMIQTARRVCGADCVITVDTVQAHYWNGEGDIRQTDKSWGDTIYTDFTDFSERALKICVEIFEQEQAEELRSIFADCDCVRFLDGVWYKFTKKAATKERAILELCAVCGMSTEEITAFGDDLVDIGMLRLCGRGIAMGNAIEEVKAAADQVIGSNEEEGIALYLEELLHYSQNKQK